MALARKRQVKKVDSTPSEGDSAQMVGGSTGNPKEVPAHALQQSALPPKPNLKKRVSKQGGATVVKRPKAGEGGGFHLQDEASDSEVKELDSLPAKDGGGLAAIPPGVASGSGTFPKEGALPSGGVEGDTFLRLSPGQGWLGDDPEKHHLGAFSLFTLPSDKAIVEAAEDEKVLREAKEALGKFGTWFMEAADRVMINRHRAVTEYNKAVLEKNAKSAAWKEMKEVKGNLDAATQALKREREAHAASVGELAKAQDGLEVEKGVSASLRSEVENLRKALAVKETELAKVTDTLEKVEQNADILYEDCVKRYKASVEFAEEVDLKAGAFHEEGWNDCFKFIGAGNVADPEAHKIEIFRDIEADKYEQAQVEAEKNREVGSEKRQGAEEEEGSKAEVEKDGLGADGNVASLV